MSILYLYFLKFILFMPILSSTRIQDLAISQANSVAITDPNLAKTIMWRTQKILDNRGPDSWQENVRELGWRYYRIGKIWNVDLGAWINLKGINFPELTRQDWQRILPLSGNFWELAQLAEENPKK